MANKQSTSLSGRAGPKVTVEFSPDELMVVMTSTMSLSVMSKSEEVKRICRDVYTRLIPLRFDDLGNNAKETLGGDVL